MFAGLFFMCEVQDIAAICVNLGTSCCLSFLSGIFLFWFFTLLPNVVHINTHVDKLESDDALKVIEDFMSMTL